MKVLLVNGSPHEYGCTHTALQEIAGELNRAEVAAEIFWLGNNPLSGCLACMKCMHLKRCVFEDRVNEFIAQSEHYDGFIFGSPVYYAAPNGSLVAFMDRVFFAETMAKLDRFYLKPAAAIVSARRGGTTSAYDQLNKYFAIKQMPIISSQYWNMVYGNSPEEVRQDLEGLQTMRTLARNMAFFLKCKRIALENGLSLPERETNMRTNFVR